MTFSIQTEGIVQVAGVLDHDEASLLLDAGVDWIGLPLELPDGREDLGRAQARELIRGLGLEDRVVIITYATEPNAVIGLARELGARRVQLHGPMTTERLRELRARAPELALLKSVVVRDDAPGAALAEALEAEPWCDAFLTDTFDPATGRRGATGRTHDWAVDRALVERTTRPLLLAGGLTPENVRAAILAARPAGVDAHTGVEAPTGRKDPDRVRRFVTEARRSFLELASTSTHGASAWPSRPPPS